MKTLIIILTLLSFVQSTLIPLDLVLIVLILRAYLVTEKGNLYLGFGFGILLSLLSNTVLGLHSIILLVVIEATYLLKKTPLSGNILVVVPLVIMASLVYKFFLSLTLNQSMAIFPKVVIEALIALPIFLGVRIWEERFTPKKEVKLKF